MKKILIIGKRGFIGNSLSAYLKRFFNTTHISFKNLNNYRTKINDFDFIINTSIHEMYIKSRYNNKYDNDTKISDLLNKNKSKYIFLSTRKVYQSKANIRENSRLLPKSNYSKNKLITEKKLTNKLKNNLIILRISNIIGNKDKIKKIHHTFIDIHFDNLKKGFVIDNKKDFKDFIGADKFCEIVKNIIQNNLKGIYNVSIGKKIYLNDLIMWLNKHNSQKIIVKDKHEKQNDNFFLNNKKLMSKIKVKNSELELKNYCYKISKKIFS